MKKLRKFVSAIAALVLVAALLCGCAGNKAPQQSTDIAFDTDATEFGTGTTAFTLEVTNPEGTTKDFTVRTDEATVGKALLDLGLIAGEDSDYGLYVKTVMGITLDYDVDGKYWAFYIDGEYGMTGVDQTEIAAGSTYALRAE